MHCEKSKFIYQWRLGARSGITQRTIRVRHSNSPGRCSSRKLMPVNPKTTGDHLLLKRIAANLSQPEVAVKAGVSERTVPAIRTFADSMATFRGARAPRASLSAPTRTTSGAGGFR